MSKALMIIPTYNEVENIVSLSREVLEQKTDIYEIEVLVVDDASADGTADSVKELMQEDSRVHLLQRPSKLGLGTAYIAGFRYALDKEFTCVGTMDADFSHAPKHLPDMLALLQNNDVVIGSRYVPGGGIENWGIHRHILSGTANFLARLAGGLKTRDCTTGYRLYKTDFLKKLDLDSITSHGYSCLMELVYVCQKAGASIAESPIIFQDRRAGESKISKAEIFKAFATLYQLLCYRFR